MIRDRLRLETKKMYGSAENAYGAIDYNGKGYITEQEFLDSIVMNRQPFNREQLKLFFND